MRENELRGPLARQIERLADDLVIGRHGDPHMAFAVLVYPDREPAVVAIQPDHSPRDLAEARRPKEGTPGVPFPWAEFVEAKHGFDDAHLGLVVARRGREPGESVSEMLVRGWDRRRMAPIEKALRDADEEAARPAKCPYCSQRFTERGLPMHLRKAAVCSRKHLAANQEALDAHPGQAEETS